MTLLSWDLVSPVEYTLGEELIFDLHLEAPANTEAENFYVMGALYTDTTYITDSIFGILKAAEVDYAVNNATHMTLWELNPEQAVELPCRFIFNQSNCLLALFLMRMVGDEPSLDDDVEVAQISVQLVAPVVVPIWEQIMPLISMALMFAIILPMTKGMFKR